MLAVGHAAIITRHGMVWLDGQPCWRRFISHCYIAGICITPYQKNTPVLLNTLFTLLNTRDGRIVGHDIEDGIIRRCQAG